VVILEHIPRTVISLTLKPWRLFWSRAKLLVNFVQKQELFVNFGLRTNVCDYFILKINVSG